MSTVLYPSSMQCGNMAREGLRTLVVGKKVLAEEQYASFEVWEAHAAECFAAAAS